MALKRFIPCVFVAGVAIAIAWGFAAMTLHVNPAMGLPLDDSYIYLTYAKQFGRAQPFSYFPGGGYSAGSTSVLWPMLLAPFWALGARGHALVWVSYGMCSALFTAVAIGCYRFASRFAGNRITGVLAGVMAAVIGPFAWSALAGMEVAFAAALLIATLLLLWRQPPHGPPSWKLALVLAATSLSRPEATAIVVAIVGWSVIVRLANREWSAAARWLVPLAAPLTWVLANRALAGNFFPNTGVVKSHFYLPGFTWSYWKTTVIAQTGALAKAMFWAPTSPFLYPRVIAVLFLVGAIRLIRWARRAERTLVGVVAVGAPLALMLAVVCTSGVGGWSVQNLRYIATAMPLVVLVATCGLAPPAVIQRTVLAKGWLALTAVLGLGFAIAAWSGLRDNMLLFAQGAMDTNAQVVTLGTYIHDKLPTARVMFHDAGAIAYYGDGPVYDMLGLVTNDQAAIANNGPGSRFEFLESLPPEQRPTHFAYYPGWMGSAEFFGEVLVHTPLRPGLPTHLHRMVGDADMQIIAANWDHVGTAERPLNDHTGWRVVDRLDIADLASERAHHWIGGMGERHFGDPTAHWSMVERETGAAGLLVDGGRTIRDHRGETFRVTIDPTKPTRIVIRTGGQASYPHHDAIAAPIVLKLFAGAKELGHLKVSPPNGAFSELAFNVPQRLFHEREIEVRTEATGAYRVFHWFVLQPE